MSDFAQQFKEYNIVNHGVRLPIINTSGDNFEYLYSLCDDGCQAKIQSGHIAPENIKKYADRLAYELKVLKKHGLVDYFLLIHDVLSWCDKNGIARGYARGSSAGSLVFYLMGCNHIDPIKHDLPFTRFISEARLQSNTVDGIIYLAGRSLPDFDADCSYINRHKILKYIEDRHPDKTSKILTLSTLSGKILIKECCKVVLDYSEQDAQRISEMVERIFGKVQSLSDTYKNNDDFRAWADTSDLTKKCYQIACSLENLIKTKGQHASGVAISYQNITDLVPLELSRERERVSAYPMEDIAEMMVKLDILGLKNTDVNAETCSLLGINSHTIDVNDPSIYRYFELNDNFYGLFQISDGLTKKTCIEVKPKNIDELSCVLSLSRPGSLKDIPKYLEYKRSGILDKIHPAIDKCLASTANIIIYQEQINQICIEVYGFDPVEADSVRYGVSKKKLSEIKKFESIIFQKGIERGIPEEVTKQIWRTINDSADYLFCLSPDTVVETKNGYKMMYQIEVGDEIKSYDIDNDLDIFTQVTDICRGERELYRVEFNDGRQIKSSLKHKFLCEDMQMRPLGDIISGQYKILSKRGELRGQTIKSIEELGSQNVIDFEVAHKDHNFYANGIVVSNSKNHAYAYSYTTAVNTYLKANHPKEFFLVCLGLTRSEPDPTGEIQKIQEEMGKCGMKLLAPDLVGSQLDFSIEGNNIRFGLKYVKGISDKTIDKLSKFKGAFTDKFQIFSGASDAGLNRGVMAALIQAGVMDKFLTGSRSKTVLELQLWALLKDRERQICLSFAAQYNYDLLKIISDLNKVHKNEKGNPVIKDSRMATIRRDFEEYQEIYRQNSKRENLASYFYETKLLGYSYSQNLTKIYKEKCPELIQIVELDKIEVESRVSICGQIKEAFYGTSRAKGTKYCKLNIRDSSGSCDVLLFTTNKRDTIGEMERLNNGKFIEDQIVVVRGRKKGDSIFAENVAIQDATIYTKLGELKEKDVDKPEEKS